MSKSIDCLGVPKCHAEQIETHSVARKAAGALVAFAGRASADAPWQLYVADTVLAFGLAATSLAAQVLLSGARWNRTIDLRVISSAL